MPIYNFLLVICWIVFAVVWVISAGRTKKNLSIQWKTIIIRVLISIAVVVYLQTTWGHNVGKQIGAYSPGSFYGTFGVIACAVGIAFAIWARVHLGKNWGMPMSVKEKPELVTSGPYAYVRHPIYTGMILAILGSTLVAGPVWLIVLAAFAVYFTYSATQEEKLMTKEFPGQYPAYKKRTKMLIPFLF